MKIKILSYTNDPERLIATAAKLCYAGCNIEELMEKQTPEAVEKFITMLSEMGHESPLEHVSFTFAIEGVSRITEQQLTRHRIASYSIQSGRYVNRDNAQFYMPADIKDCEEASEIYTSVIEHSKKAYEELTNELMYHYILADNMDLTNDRCYPEGMDDHLYGTIAHYKENYKQVYNAFHKKAIENARCVFPNSLETKIVCTMNVRTLLNFFKHRCCHRAQDEIKALAKLMLREVRKICPTLFKYAGPACVSGICPEGKMQCVQLKGKIPTNLEVKELIAKHFVKY